MAKPPKPKKVGDLDSINSSEELIQLEKELKVVDPDVFEGVPVERKEAILRSVSVTMIHERTHSGPLPDPDSIIKYDSAITDGANRIMVMAEKQQEHRINMERIMIEGNVNLASRGQVIGGLIGFFGICIAAFLSYNGHETVGGIIGGTTVVTLVSAFIYGKRNQSKKSN